MLVDIMKCDPCCKYTNQYQKYSSRKSVKIFKSVESGETDAIEEEFDDDEHERIQDTGTIYEGYNTFHYLIYLDYFCRMYSIECLL